MLVCSSGQLFFSFFQGNVNVNQQAFRLALGIQNSELPWMVGSYLVALGLSVILSGSLSDLMPPRVVVVVAFVWLTIWNIVGFFSLTPERATLFFFMRAMQGLSVGVIVSGSMSILGRVYSPGLRKTRVFSAMASVRSKAEHSLHTFLGSLGRTRFSAASARLRHTLPFQLSVQSLTSLARTLRLSVILTGRVLY